MSKDNGSRVITNEDAADKSKMGYVRCSTVEQNEARQLEAFRELHLYKIFIEKASAKDTDRPMLKQMLEYAREGDTIYIKDFSRLARNTEDLLRLIADLTKRKIKLVSLQENFDTATPTGQLIITIIGAINTFERQILLERQREGIFLAKQRGAFKGRKPVEKPDNWTEVYNLYKTREITGTEAIRRLGMKRTTFYKFVDAEKGE